MAICSDDLSARSKIGVEELVEGKIKLNEGNKIKMREEFRKVENRGK